MLEAVTQQILLSENIEKTGFDIATGTSQERAAAVEHLDAALARIRDTRSGLRYGSAALDLSADHSKAFDDLIEAEIEPHFVAMSRAAVELVEKGSSGELLPEGAAGAMAELPVFHSETTTEHFGTPPADRWIAACGRNRRGASTPLSALDPVHTGEVAGVEALARWEHPEIGMVPTERFIRLAEETDLIVPLGLWGMNAACGQLKRWHDSGMERFAVSINVSSRQLRRGNLAEMLEQTLDRTGLAARWLKVELTARTLADDTETARRTLDRLRSLGVEIAIDDCGTGYSSLSYLKSFPIDAIKIDREFVRDSVTDDDTATVAQSMVALAKALRLEVIAEGVETREQLDLVRSHGCTLIQGFYISRPLAVESIPHAIDKGFTFLATTRAVLPRVRSAK